jgi:hypothetical protein
MEDVGGLVYVEVSIAERNEATLHLSISELGCRVTR